MIAENIGFFFRYGSKKDNLAENAVERALAGGASFGGELWNRGNDFVVIGYGYMKKNDEYTLTLVRLAYALPFIIPALFLSKYHRWIPLFFRDCYCHSHRYYRSYSLPEGNQDISFIINPSVSCLHTCFRSPDFIRSFKRNP